VFLQVFARRADIVVMLVVVKMSPIVFSLHVVGVDSARERETPGLIGADLGSLIGSPKTQVHMVGPM